MNGQTRTDVWWYLRRVAMIGALKHPALFAQSGLRNKKAISRVPTFLPIWLDVWGSKHLRPFRPLILGRLSVFFTFRTQKQAWKPRWCVNPLPPFNKPPKQISTSEVSQKLTIAINKVIAGISETWQHHFVGVYTGPKIVFFGQRGYGCVIATAKHILRSNVLEYTWLLLPPSRNKEKASHL